jgi:uncharacterized membrane protein
MTKIDILGGMIVPGIIMLAIDFIYLSFNKTAFEHQIIAVQRTALQIKWLGVVFCYLFLIFGLYYFILREHRPIIDAFIFGLVVYGVYDSTTYALLKKWDLGLAVMDALWGGVLLALTTFFTYRIERFLH